MLINILLFISFFFIFAIPVLAGKFCINYLDCLPWTFGLLSYIVLPIGITIFALVNLIHFLVKHRLPKIKYLVGIFLLSYLVAHFGFLTINGIIDTKRSNNWYQQKQKTQAEKLSFILYEPTYIVSGFDFVENVVDYDGSLVFKYYDRSSQSSKESMATNLYIVSVMRNTQNPRPSIYLVNDNILALKKIGDTAIIISGTINQNEANKVISSLKEIDPSDIKFHSDWARSR